MKIGNFEITRSDALKVGIPTLAGLLIGSIIGGTVVKSSWEISGRKMAFRAGQSYATPIGAAVYSDGVDSCRPDNLIVSGYGSFVLFHPHRTYNHGPKGEAVHTYAPGPGQDEQWEQWRKRFDTFKEMGRREK